MTTAKKNADPFVRVVPGSGARMLHAAKPRFPNESLCGRRLQEAQVKPEGKFRCHHCVHILKKAQANNGT